MTIQNNYDQCRISKEAKKKKGGGGGGGGGGNRTYI